MKELTAYISLIKNGEIVAFPTETVYGLGADAWNPTAIKKVFETKGRPSDNPLIVHVSSSGQVLSFTENISEHAQLLVDEFWPGPLTIVFKKKPEVLDAVTAGLNTVAVRMPDHPVALELIASTGPLVAPSANRSGRPSPTKAIHVKEDFGTDFPVIDGGATKVGLESTVVDMTGEIPAILRPGSISHKQIEQVLGVKIEESFFHPEHQPKSPGQKYSHYKPNAEVCWYEGQDLSDSSSLFLMLDTDSASHNVITYNGDLNQLARELFDRFRQADHEGFKSVVIDNLSSKNEDPIYAALMNRIEKALN